MTREVTDEAGDRWAATVVSHGRTSGYLNPKVHRPVVRFTCQTRPAPPRYAPLAPPAADLGEVSQADLADLLGRARPH